MTLLLRTWPRFEVSHSSDDNKSSPVYNGYRQTFTLALTPPLLYLVFTIYLLCLFYRFSLLLKRLLEFTGPLPDYQMGFQNNRSSEDQLLVLRGILDERWQKGRITYILSLDIQQAFDRVDINRLPAALQQFGVPCFLIDRITAACLNETTSVQWYKFTTPPQIKTRGIKQGCPISPFLFTIIMHIILERVQSNMPQLVLKQDANFKLPCVLAYADDLLFVTENRDEISEIMTKITHSLSLDGLEVNEGKTLVVVRNPNVLSPIAEHLERFGDYELKVVSKLRYLGGYISSTLHRSQTVYDRINSAWRAFRLILPFVERYNISWGMARRLYLSTIVPVATYALKVSTITKANRSALREMEHDMVSQLYHASKKMGKCCNCQSDTLNCGNNCINFEQHGSVRGLLNNRTINASIHIGRLSYYILI